MNPSTFVTPIRLTLRERPTADERIAGHVARTAADRRQTAQIAIRTDAALAVARILADAVEAGRPTGRTVAITVAFRFARRERAADVAFGAFADGAMVLDANALGAVAALRARRRAAEVLAALLAAALVIGFALVATAGQRAAGEAGQTRTGGHVVDDFAAGVLAARRWVALFLCTGAGGGRD